MFAVDDIDQILEKLYARGTQLVGEIIQYKNAYRLCYIRGPEGILIRLAEEIRGTHLFCFIEWELVFFHFIVV